MKTGLLYTSIEKHDWNTTELTAWSLQSMDLNVTEAVRDHLNRKTKSTRRNQYPKKIFGKFLKKTDKTSQSYRILYDQDNNLRL